MNRFAAVLLCGCFFTQSLIAGSDLEERLASHLIIGDPDGAILEANDALQMGGDKEAVYSFLVKAYAVKGDQSRMMDAWREFETFKPDEQNHRALLEEMSWSVIRHAARSTSPFMRSYATIGAALCNAVPSIALLESGLDDTHALVRFVSARGASQMRDAALQRKVLERFEKESNPRVRVELIQAVGRMRIHAAEPLLLEKLSGLKPSQEEAEAATQALLNLGLQRSYIPLLNSPYATVRRLATLLVGTTEGQERERRLIAMAEDSHASVRAAAMRSLALAPLGEPDKVIALARRHSRDQTPDSGITAAWLLTILEPDEGNAAFRRWLNHSSSDVRQFAAGALADAGPSGIPLMQQVMKTTKDPFVAMNCALGLIGQRCATDLCCDKVYRWLSRGEERMMWQTRMGFRYLTRNKSRHEPWIPNLPEAMHQQAQLELLNLLAMLRYPHAEEAVKRFLKDTQWGLSGVAALVLLSEGDSATEELIAKMIEDPDQKIRLQAALVLGMWGESELSARTLESLYACASRSDQEKILECLGGIGSQESLPFLTEQLDHSSEAVRVIAASSILRCLEH